MLDMDCFDSKIMLYGRFGLARKEEEKEKTQSC